ncbi:hypothetical protein BC938DRAFT_479863 [Jimgerdemannia flammicorona]|uniref:Uncharacterized protein n=1 Tax=Jimgerdemannia flammicorona TaxID=994334 RepID=A0A433QXJ7_9FUNG|nr:hypothetical protein BC938DRAFT_479863 [Jimgerdemannia flammicorona]
MFNTSVTSYYLTVNFTDPTTGKALNNTALVAYAFFSSTQISKCNKPVPSVQC